MRRLALPPLCLLCSAPAVSSNICAECRNDLTRLPAERCPRCAEPTLGGEICGACLAHPPSFDRVVAAHAYAFPLDRLIQSFKYAGNLPAAPLLAELMQEAIGEETPPDVIVPMPLSTQRLRERGFNQSLELARILGSQTGVPVDHDACVRLRHGEAQSSLPWGQRAANVRGAFACTRDFSGLSVAVIDDVMTTGATLEELSRVLRRCGATQITGWMAARTLSTRT